MMRRSTFVLMLFIAVTVAWAQRQPLVTPVYYLVTAPELVENVPVHGELTSASGQNFKDGSFVNVLVLWSAGNETVEVRLESDDFDTYLSLFDPEGRLLDFSDYYWGGETYYASRVRTYLPDAGTYLVVVSGQGYGDAGKYTVTRSVYVPPPKVAVDVTLPGSYRGYLSEAAADSVWVSVSEPATVLATVRSSEFDTFVEVYDQWGTFLEGNDDFEGTDAGLILDLSVGRYEFLVKGYWDDAYGEYAFDIDFYERPPAIVVSVDAAGAFAGFLAPHAVDSYVLTLMAPAIVTVDLHSQEFDTVLEAFDATGVWIATNDDYVETDSRLQLEVEAGTYVFEVSSYWGSESGRYTITFDW